MTDAERNLLLETAKALLWFTVPPLATLPYANSAEETRRPKARDFVGAIQAVDPDYQVPKLISHHLG